MTQPRNVAIVGGGVAGLSAAWLLSHRYPVTLFEANSYLGGHANTLDVATADGTVNVDTGFVVFNRRNYPNLERLFGWLDVPTQATEMSFSLSADNSSYEYAGSNLGTLFAQRGLLANADHWRLLGEILRFNRCAHRALARGVDDNRTLGEFLDDGRFSRHFQAHYLLPMGAAIWSCPMPRMRRFPVHSFLAFFRNHGLLDLVGRPRWRTVRGGSQTYVEKMQRRLRGHCRTTAVVRALQRRPDGVVVCTDGGAHEFDAAVLACHADQALALLSEPDAAERSLLGAFDYQPNVAWLHSDPTLMPSRRRVWSAWNYLARGACEEACNPSVTYWMNRLQRLRGGRDFFVSLNPQREPALGVEARIDYRHPVFDTAALAAQQRLGELQGRHRTWFCGSYFGYGFHEDALSSAVGVCASFGVEPPWQARQPWPLRGEAAQAPA